MKRALLVMALVCGVAAIGTRTMVAQGAAGATQKKPAAKAPVEKATAMAPGKVTLLDAKGASVGTATISAVKTGGVSIALAVKGLEPGEHAFHIHSVAKCEGP